jgi:3-hydroxyisobutyrate dehydrogenase-like beta-hydroxyacid dehydrogenase
MSTGENSEAQRAGVIGLGMIGSGVAISMINSGRAPLVYDIRREVAEGIEGVAGIASSSAEVAANSDVVMVAVLDAPQARDVLGGPGGILEGASAGLIVVLLSTVEVAVVQELAELAATKGVVLLDCGVTPGQKAAQHGLVAMIGGEEEDVERARPVLEDWAKAVVHCGPPGSGMVAKIARNLVTYCCWRVVHEASVLAAGAGVDVKRFTEIIRTADPEGDTLLNLAKFREWEVGPASTDEIEQRMRMISTYVIKDLAAAHELAVEQGIELPVMETTRERPFEMLGLTEDAPVV